jgi:hypothetical protein
MKFKAKQLESAKNLIRLQSSVNARWFKKGDVVYHEGEIGDSIFFVDDNIGGEPFLISCSAHHPPPPPPFISWAPIQSLLCSFIYWLSKVSLKRSTVAIKFMSYRGVRRSVLRRFC